MFALIKKVRFLPYRQLLEGKHMEKNREQPANITLFPFIKVSIRLKKLCAQRASVYISSNVGVIWIQFFLMLLLPNHLHMSVRETTEPDLNLLTSNFKTTLLKLSKKKL
jgi:hypothetical protein